MNKENAIELFKQIRRTLLSIPKLPNNYDKLSIACGYLMCMNDIGIISTGELKTLSDETEKMIKEGIKEVKEMTIEKYAETRWKFAR